jgi:drug/metabolite transporter (DMT)-like permease
MELFSAAFCILVIKKNQNGILWRDFIHVWPWEWSASVSAWCFFMEWRIRSVNRGVIFCIIRCFTMLLPFYHRGKTNRNKLIALTVGLVGIVFMINRWMEPGNTVME